MFEVAKLQFLLQKVVIFAKNGVTLKLIMNVSKVNIFRKPLIPNEIQMDERIQSVENAEIFECIRQVIIS
jgi:hypothetical protein